MILYLAADLIWASKIKGTADALGVPARPVRTMEMLEARLAEGGVKALVLDLDKPQEAMAMIARVRGGPVGGSSVGASTVGASPVGGGAGSGAPEARIRILAWGPHVAKDLLQQARDAGADDVLTRGAFDHSMEEILLGLAGRQ